MPALLHGASSSKNSQNCASTRASSPKVEVLAELPLTQSTGRSRFPPAQFSIPSEEPLNTGELVPPSGRLGSLGETPKSDNRGSLAAAVRAKGPSVGDIICEIEAKHKESDSPITPLRRAATAPSPKLHSLYECTVLKAYRPILSSHHPPRRRLISKETNREKAFPFTTWQVAAASSLTASKTPNQSSEAFHIPQILQIVPSEEHNFQDQVIPSVPATSSYASAAVETDKPDLSHYIDQAAQTDPVNPTHQCIPDIFQAQQEPVFEFNSQIVQTSTHEESTSQSAKKAFKTEWSRESTRLGKAAQYFTDYHSIAETDRSSYWTAQNRSDERQIPKDDIPWLKISVHSDAIEIVFLEGISLPITASVCTARSFSAPLTGRSNGRNTLQSLREGQLALGPASISRAQSTELLAQGEIYTPDHIQPQEELSRAAHSAEEHKEQVSGCPSPPKYGLQREEASIVSKDSKSETKASSPAAASDPTVETPDLSAQDKRPGKQRSTSTSYWFQSDDDLTIASSPLVNLKNKTHFQSVPIIRVTRPSTDSNMVFGLGTKAVQPTHLLIASAGTPALSERGVALPAPVPTGDETSRFRRRVKSRGRKSVYKCRKALVRKHLLRVLIGKTLSETVYPQLQTVGNVTCGALEQVDSSLDMQEPPREPISTERSLASRNPVQLDGAVEKSVKKKEEEALKNTIKTEDICRKAREEKQEFISKPCKKCSGLNSSVINALPESIPDARPAAVGLASFKETEYATKGNQVGTCQATAAYATDLGVAACSGAANDFSVDAFGHPGGVGC